MFTRNIAILGPMVVVERLTAAEIQLRSPPLAITAACNNSFQLESATPFGVLPLSTPCRKTNLRFQSTQWCLRYTPSPKPHPAVICRALPDHLANPPHRCLPSCNLHRARIRRKHGRLPSNEFIERAQGDLPTCAAVPKRASHKSPASPGQGAIYLSLNSIPAMQNVQSARSRFGGRESICAFFWRVRTLRRIFPSDI